MSVFPSLQELLWSPSSYSDDLYFPLFRPQIHSAVFKFPHTGKGDSTCRPDRDPQSHTFLTWLQVSSPRVNYLCINASWQRIGEHHSRVITSFEHLVDLHLISSVSTTSFRELAAMPRLKSLRAGHVWSDELAPPLSHPLAQISAPRLMFISIYGDCHLLAHLFTTLHAPILKAVAFNAICNDPAADDLGYIPCLKVLATLGTPTTMEELHIVLDKDIPPMRMHLAALINPLLGLRNMKCFTLLCPKLRLVADDDFAAVTRAWPKLRSFRLPQAYWDSSVDSDDEDGYTDGDTIPTPEVLRLFRDHCPDLWELVLPHLDLDTGIPDLAVLPAALPHRLKRLVFGAESDARNFEGREDRARELVKAKAEWGHKSR
ncbi:hypothetical protein LXA43DRAFT_1090973 [Ganoderma leucocontextum]|nr:hypothetical protein LXA43DRAFT_1090973 [Ganoderma leucocontextum]